MFNQEGWQFAELAIDQAFHPTFRYVSDFRKGNTQKVKWLCHWLTVEVPTGDDMAFFGNDWVICDRVDFDFNFFFYVSDRVLAGSVNLRDTTECVRVLDPLLGCNGCVFASFKEVTDVASSCQLSTLRTDSMKVFFKWTGNPIVDFH